MLQLSPDAGSWQDDSVGDSFEESEKFDERGRISGLVAEADCRKEVLVTKERWVYIVQSTVRSAC